MKITNKTSRTLTIAASGQTVEPGGTAEVEPALGKSLCKQQDVWGAAPAKKTTSDEPSQEG